MSEFRQHLAWLADELDEQADRYIELSQRSRRPSDRCEGKAFGLRRSAIRIRMLLARPDLTDSGRDGTAT